MIASAYSYRTPACTGEGEKFQSWAGWLRRVVSGVDSSRTDAGHVSDVTKSAARSSWGGEAGLSSERLLSLLQGRR